MKSANTTTTAVHFLHDMPPDEVTPWCQRELGLPNVRTEAASQVWDEEIASLPRDIAGTLSLTRWQWVVYPWRSLAVRIPDEDTYWAVVTSRNYPIITRAEQQRMRTATVLLAGLSTGRAVAQQLSRLGVGSFVIADADHMSVSNFNRLLGAGLADLGLPKVVSVSRELRELNPYLTVVEHSAFLDLASTEELLDTHGVDVIVEMIDNVDAKLAIRHAARARDLTVVMATDMDWDPFIDIEEPNRALFNGRLDDHEIELFADPATDFQTKTSLVMRFMALEHWAERSQLSGQLASQGLVGFWSQTAPAAAVAGALAARAVFDLLRGNTNLPPRAGLSLRDPIGTTDPVDESEPLVTDLRTKSERQ